MRLLDQLVATVAKAKQLGITRRNWKQRTGEIRQHQVERSTAQYTAEDQADGFYSRAELAQLETDNW